MRSSLGRGGLGVTVTTRQYMLLIALFLACTCPITCCGPARAGESEVVSTWQVCAIQHKIRWRSAGWSDVECQRLARAFNATRAPRLTEAVCLNESDFREDAVSFVRPGVYDVGLCGVRCVLASAGTVSATRGLRSSAGAASLPGGRCTNGPARGYTLRQLLDGPTNVRLADQILHGVHGGSLRGYGGDTRGGGYASRVGAVLAALGGVDVFAKRRRGDWRRGETRLEKLVRQVVEVLSEGPVL
jgi:hypothetical protein